MLLVIREKSVCLYCPSAMWANVTNVMKLFDFVIFVIGKKHHCRADGLQIIKKGLLSDSMGQINLLRMVLFS